ncbi:putative selenate ABC transporter substrate-binding protein [Hymenobacter coalescens]
MKRLLAFVGAFLGLLTAVSAQSSAPARPLVVATYAYDTNDRVAHISPLAAELARAVGREAQVRSFPSVPALLTAIRAGEVDVALLNTLGYVALQAAAPAAVTPLARLQLPAGSSGDYQACLVTRRTAAVRSVAEVADRAAELRLVFAGPHSTSGHLVPRLWLATQGLTAAETSFRQVSYAGSHAAVLSALRSGQAEVGACGLGEFRQLQRAGQAADLQLLWTSDAIPLGPVVCRATLPAAEQQALRQVLLQAQAAHPEALARLRQGWAEARGTDGFVSATAAEYEDFFRVIDDTDARLHALPGQGAELRRLLAQYVR